MSRHQRSPVAHRINGAGNKELPSEKDIPLLATLRANYEEAYQEWLTFPTVRHNREVNLALHRVGNPHSDTVIVFIHGVLADSSTFDYVAGAMDRRFDLWLIDLPGCGSSEKPKRKQLAADGYSPTALADRVWQVIDQAIRHREQTQRPARRVMLVAHSLGGTIAMRMFADPELRSRHHRARSRVNGMVLISPCDVAVQAEIPVFRQIMELNDPKAFTAKFLGLVRQASEQATCRGYHNPQRATHESAENLCRILSEPSTRHAAQAMLRQAVPWQKEPSRPLWAEIDKLEAQYRNIDVPCLILWGKWDETLPASMGHKLKNQIRGARLEVFKRVGHSVPTEAPLMCVDSICSMLGENAGYAGAANRVAMTMAGPSSGYSIDPGQRSRNNNAVVASWIHE